MRLAEGVRQRGTPALGVSLARAHLQAVVAADAQEAVPLICVTRGRTQ